MVEEVHTERNVLDVYVDQAISESVRQPAMNAPCVVS
jgi:hypothetical protein